MNLRSSIQLFLETYPSIVYSKSGLDFNRYKLSTDFKKIQTFLLSNLRAGEIVAIDLPKDIYYLLTILCCLEGGIPFVPLRREWPEARKQQIKKVSLFSLKFEEDLLAKALSSDPINNAQKSFPVFSASTAYIMFTSGTTGEPKGVEISRGALENYFSWINSEQTLITPEDRLLNTTDYTFDVSFADIGILLTKHPFLYLSDFRDNLFRMLNEMEQFKITIHCTTPNNYSILLSDQFASRANLSHLKVALVCGSRFSPNLLSRFQKTVPQATVYNCYGPTENTVYCICKKLTGNLMSSGNQNNISIGIPLPGTGAIVVRPDLSIANANEEGELLLSGRQLMTRYCNNPEETQKRLCTIEGERYYRSGDIAFRDETGEFYVTGRVDDEIKINSQRANLSDIECYIQRLSYVQLCCLIALPHDVKGVELVLYVILKTEISKVQIFSDLTTVLLKHQIPQEIHIVSDLPRNNSGKLCRNTLRALHSGSAYA